MDRATWLAQRRRAVREQYDAEAPTYRTEGGDYPTPKHPAFIDRLLEATPPDGVVLDAACGAGKWFGAVREAGRRVVGTDQSAGMVEQALTTGLAERVEHIGLQELAFEAEFDAAMVIDAMENVAPEDWPVVAGNLARAVKPGGGLFVTLEEQEDEAINVTFRALAADGQPAVRGEVIEGDVAGYHYYPGRAQALVWLTDAGFTLLDEDSDDHGDWGYRLLLLRRT
jgi:2-polyprenyl-3-methyl-5-hydroxy-6-metoxy-1,4-benzoquinol methylase